jgi:quercetin dioxygenase-like cupin family protein
MGLIELGALPEVQPKPGWRGRFFHSAHMTFAYYEIEAGATLHRHAHENEEVWHITQGVLEMTLGERRLVANAGNAVVIEGGTEHAAVAREYCSAIVVDYPLRHELAGMPI